MDSLLGKRDEIYGFQTLYREIGYYISKLELYEKSLTFFDEAVKHSPNDKRGLIGRSRARAKACEYAGALKDINEALKLDPDDLGVLADKALNTFLSCAFEDGLVQNTRLISVRHKPNHFAMGVMHCTNAIENCIAEKAGKPLRDHFRVIRKLAWKANNEAQMPYEPKPRHKPKKKKIKLAFIEPVAPIIRKSVKPVADTLNLDDDEEVNLSVKDSLHSITTKENRVPQYSQPFLFKPLQNYTTNIENYIAEKYLDSMYLDKIFLKKLQTEPGYSCPNEKGSEKLKKLANIGYKTVSYKQELLRTRRPFYYIKYREARSSGALKLRQEQELEAQQETTKKEADILLAKMQDAFNEKKIRVMCDIVEKLKIYCDSKPKRLLLCKELYLDEIYKLVRKGFYDLNRLNKNQYVWDQEKRIFNAFGVPYSREPSRDSVIDQFKNAIIDHKKLTKLFERRLKVAVSSEEMCWCYHELTRHLAELKRYDLARAYGKKCVQEGYQCHPEWVVNGSLLLTMINIQQRNKSDARAEIHAALKVAQAINDSRLEDYLNRCLIVIDKIEFDDIQGPKVLKKRERTIVSMMASAKMKEEVKHLFQMMSTMPASRRMLIMPGVRIEDLEKKPAYGRKASIRPVAKDRDTESIVSSVSVASRKLPKKKEETKGVGFMKLIEYHMD